MDPASPGPALWGFMSDLTVNRFRKKRGERLRKLILKTAETLGRDVVILDVGGRPDYWENVLPERVAKIIIMNYEEGELIRDSKLALFENVVGDARDLSAYADGSVDFVHSNSVIEHVGRWGDMKRMASEVRRVGVHGWLQTPAWECPIEPHYQLPFIHWFNAPARAKMLQLKGRFRKLPLDNRRGIAESVNLLSKTEFVSLFPQTTLFVERIAGLPKSYTAYW
jgi:hypothetical protein